MVTEKSLTQKHGVWLEKLSLSRNRLHQEFRNPRPVKKRAGPTATAHLHFSEPEHFITVNFPHKIPCVSDFISSHLCF